jgi:hypothetical protein
VGVVDTIALVVPPPPTMGVVDTGPVAPVVTPGVVVTTLGVVLSTPDGVVVGMPGVVVTVTELPRDVVPIDVLVVGLAVSVGLGGIVPLVVDVVWAFAAATNARVTASERMRGFIEGSCARDPQRETRRKLRAPRRAANSGLPGARPIARR